MSVPIVVSFPLPDSAGRVVYVHTMRVDVRNTIVLIQLPSGILRTYYELLLPHIFYVRYILSWVAEAQIKDDYTS